MKTMHLTIVLLSALGLLFARAAVGQDAAKLDPVIEAYLETSTVAIAHVDLSKINVPSIVDWTTKQLGEIPEQTLTVKFVGAALVHSLVDAGTTHVYATASLLDAAQGGAALFLPCREPEAVKTLLETFVVQIPKEFNYKVFTTGGLVVVTTPSIWARLESKPNKGREKLLAAIQPGLAHAAAVAIDLPERLRHEVAHVWPDRIPDDAPVQLSPKQLMNDLQSITLFVDLSPAPSISVVASAESDEGAQRTGELAVRLREMLPAPASELITSEGTAVSVVLSELQLAGALAQVLSPLQAAQGTAQSMNNLQQIMLAMHNYHETYKYFPPRETRTKADQPLLSWRVHILPYVGEQELYGKFDLKQPWDSPQNAKLIEQMPAVYKVGGDKLAKGQTRYVLPVIEGGAWFGEGPPLTFPQIKDGSSNTIAVVIGPKEKAVAWTKPEELQLSAEAIVEQLFGDAQVLLIGMFDGSWRAVERSNSPELLRGYITIDGRELGDLK